MASPIIGRTHCPECSFEAAHVKQSEKCLYRYCPGCGAMYHATGQARADALRAKMRPVDTLDPPTPRGKVEPPPTPTPTPVPSPSPTPTPKRRGLFA